MDILVFHFSDTRLHYIIKKYFFEREHEEMRLQRILQGTVLIPIQNYSEEISLIQLMMYSEEKSHCLPLTKTFKHRQAHSNLQVLLSENRVF